MKKLFATLSVAITSTVICVGVVYAATTHNITSFLGGQNGDAFDVKGTMLFDSIKVGRQGTGGVTFFNGTIINSTTGTGGADLPVTFGDNVRIDGRVYRGANAGTSDSQPFIVNDNMQVVGSLTVGSLSGSGIVSSDNLADDSVTTAKIKNGTIAAADLANGAVTSTKITNGTIATADLSDSAVTTAKISDGTIATADLADSSVTPAKINGTGGANLPIAYGYCDENGNMLGGTSNVTCSWNQVQGAYNITIEGETYVFNQYITVATTVINDYYASVYSHSGILDVFITNANGVGGLQSDFSFVVYKI